MRAQTITTKARAGARARTKRTILALSLAVVLLAATASTASADRVLSPWYCPPLPTSPTTIDQVPLDCLGSFSGPGPSFDFGNRQVGTTSPAQGFALGVYGTDTLTPRISVSGDYAQTDNCPPTLSATGPVQVQGCLITVTFTPTGTGAKHGTLSTGPGGPTHALTGTGVTTPTPPALPLMLSAGSDRKQRLGKKIKFDATTNNDSTLVATGSKIKKTKKQLKAVESKTFKARLKHPKRLKEKPTPPQVKIKLAATDEYGQTATEENKVKLCRRLIVDLLGGEIDCRWHRSKE